jgi:hypothetical protein
VLRRAGSGSAPSRCARSSRGRALAPRFAAPWASPRPPRRAVRGHDGAARARLHRLPRPEGRAAPDGYYPRIAGKPAGYLYNQLLNFRDGRRAYALMTNLLAPLDDAYLREIAGHFAGLDLPYPAPAPLALSAADADATARLVGKATRRAPAGLHVVPRHGDDRHGAVRARARRPAARLSQCAARRLAQRQARRAEARLHGGDREQARPAGNRSPLGLAGSATGARRREARRGVRGAGADGLRRRAGDPATGVQR